MTETFDLPNNLIDIFGNKIGGLRAKALIVKPHKIKIEILATGGTTWIKNDL